MRLLMKPRFAFFTLAVLATRGVAQENSDFIAYPKDYTSMTQFAKMDRQLAFNRLPGLSADYRIGPGDVLRIEVLGEIQEGVKVTGEGDITLPLIGPIPVA
jgi:protein involved in polysaccharide export with SLBB domain